MHKLVRIYTENSLMILGLVSRHVSSSFSLNLWLQSFISTAASDFPVNSATTKT